MDKYAIAELCYRNGYEKGYEVAKSECKKIEYDLTNLDYTLIGVMHFVDKWLDGEELEQDEVNRAATMREKVLQIIEAKDAEIARLQAEVSKHNLNRIS